MKRQDVRISELEVELKPDKSNERSQLHRLTRQIEESVWLPRSGKVSYISGSTTRQIN